jgi:hypothetical protein
MFFVVLKIDANDNQEAEGPGEGEERQSVLGRHGRR